MNQTTTSARTNTNTVNETLDLSNATLPNTTVDTSNTSRPTSPQTATQSSFKVTVKGNRSNGNVSITFQVENAKDQDDADKTIKKLMNGGIFNSNHKVEDIFNDKDLINKLKKAGIKISKISGLKFEGATISPLLSDKVTIENCTFTKDATFHFNGTKLTCTKCTFENNVAIHSTNEDANVTIEESKLPSRIDANITGDERTEKRFNALKFIGKFNNLTLDLSNTEGGLIDTERASLNDPITFKGIEAKKVLNLYGGSIIKRKHLNDEIIKALIEAKKGSSQISDNEAIEQCKIQEREAQIRTITNLDDSFDRKEQVENETKISNVIKDEKKRINKSLEETENQVVEKAYNKGFTLDKIRETFSNFIEERSKAKKSNDKDKKQPKRLWGINFEKFNKICSFIERKFRSLSSTPTRPVTPPPANATVGSTQPTTPLVTDNSTVVAATLATPPVQAKQTSNQKANEAPLQHVDVGDSATNATLNAVLNAFNARPVDRITDTKNENSDKTDTKASGQIQPINGNNFDENDIANGLYNND